MSTPATVRIQDVDVSKLIFSAKQPAPKDSLYGIENVFVSYEKDKQWPRFQFPVMTHPFDSFDATYGGNGDGSIDMLLSFDATDKKHEKTMNKLKEFDARVYELVKANSGAWLKKEIKSEVEEGIFLSGNWFPSLKNKDDKFFNIKFKIPRRAAKKGEEKTLATEVRDFNTNEVVDIREYLQPGCQVQVIGRPARVYIQKQSKMGIVWEAMVMKVKRSDQVESELFIDSDEEEEPPAAADTVMGDAEEEAAAETTDELGEEAEEDVKPRPAGKGRGKRSAGAARA
jgi:hypothetical protein